MNKKKFAILTSGGDASCMNKVLSTFVKYCYKNDIEPYFVYDGFKGLFQNKIKKAQISDVYGIYKLPGSIIKSSRFEDFKDIKIREIAAENFRKNAFDCLFVCGGNGSYIGAEKLSELGVNVICLPGTIDNDIASTDFTIGYLTSLDVILRSINEIRATIDSHDFICVVEVMGRHCVDLATMAALITEADYLITHENYLDKEEFASVVSDLRSKNKGSILIIVTELLYGQDNKPSLQEVTKYASEKINEKIRTSVLGYTQRGGLPTAFDLINTTFLTLKGIELANAGEKNIAICNVNNKYIGIDLKKANLTKSNSRKSLIEKYININ